jgi:hypothetical protein
MWWVGCLSYYKLDLASLIAANSQFGLTAETWLARVARVAIIHLAKYCTC